MRPRDDPSPGDSVREGGRCSQAAGLHRKHAARWLGPLVGLLSLLWFLVRVIPKPSRASYPCQRAAFPMASAAVLWLLAVVGSASAWRRNRAPHLPGWKALVWGALAGLLGSLAWSHWPTHPVLAAPMPHGILGIPRGILPGRVVWVHAPDATDWAGEDSGENWFATEHTDQAILDQMLSRALQSLTGTTTDAAAWDALFRHFQASHGRPPVGYRPGEIVTLKVNLSTSNARSGSATVDIQGDYEKRPGILDTIDTSPQLLLALLRQLVRVAGVPPANIRVGDPTANFPRYLWDRLHPEFPEVQYFDNFGGQGRVRTELSGERFHWSTDTTGRRADFLPVPIASADYLINCAVLKGHGDGITLGGKNWYGALLRCPDGYFRDAGGTNRGGYLNYLNLHQLGPDPAQLGVPGLGHYRPQVDLMGHPSLGGKTLLHLVDGLYGGYFWDAHPHRWKMAPFNGDWPSSLFASLDPVALDSVGHDFLRAEWPDIVANGHATPGNSLQGGAEDYLHEAALANAPPSGTYYDPGRTGQRLGSLGVHEHWNNPVDKQYSRNRGTGEGIELVALTVSRPALHLSPPGPTGEMVISWPASAAGYRLQSTPRLDGETAWRDVPESPARVNDRLMVTHRPGSAQTFYRLQP